MNGATISSAAVPATISGDWQLLDQADYDNNATPGFGDDVLLVNTVTGQYAVWLMNGAAINSAGVPATLADPNWLYIK